MRDVAEVIGRQRRPGRPTLAWWTWEQLAAASPGTAVLVDRGDRESRLTGRVELSDRPDEVVLRARTGRLSVLRAQDVVRVRPVRGLFEDGDPVLLVGVSPHRWRGGVVRTEHDQVYVETVSGFEWITESRLRGADDEVREAALVGKPGPIAGDPAVEAANAEAYDRRVRERRAHEEWA